jgi:hypothetical protein
MRMTAVNPKDDGAARIAIVGKTTIRNCPEHDSNKFPGRISFMMSWYHEIWYTVSATTRDK